MMRVVTMALVLATLGQAAAAGLESGIAAYDAGEYGVAHGELLPLASKGDRVAAYLLSRMYFAGQGRTRNTDEGIKWLRRAAESGEPVAQIQLGARYDYGLGLPQSDTDAFAWYRKAADQGSAIAQLYIGIMYNDGRGVSGDLVAAHMWLNLATAALPPGQIRNSAAQLRDAVTARLTPSQVSEAHRLARDWRPLDPPPP